MVQRVITVEAIISIAFPHAYSRELSSTSCVQHGSQGGHLFAGEVTMCLVNQDSLPDRPGGGAPFERVKYQLAACKQALDELGDLLGLVWPDLPPGTRVAALDHLDSVAAGALDSREQLAIAV